MFRPLKVFFGTPGTRPFLVMACVIFASLAEVVGIGALLAMATLISTESQGHSSKIVGYINGFLERLGFEPNFTNTLLLVAVFMLLRGALAFLAQAYVGVTAARVAISFRQRLMDAIFGARWSFFVAQRQGTFANAVANDASRAGDAYLLSAQYIAFAVQVISYILVSILVSWKLAVLGVCASVILAVALRKLIQMSRRAGRRQTDRTSALVVFLGDMLTNIKPLKSMNRQGSMRAAADALLTKLKRALLKRETARAGLDQGSDTLLALILLGTVYIANGVWNISLAELAVSGVIFAQITSRVSKLQKMLQSFGMLESAYFRTEELIEKAQAQAEDLGGGKLPDIEGGIRLVDVSLAHEGKTIVSSVNMEIPAGAITVLYGPSGAGKTTIVDMLIGLHRPGAGQILIGETPLQDLSIKAWRSQIGYVPQELNLLHTSIRENIRLGDETLSDGDVTAALEKAGASAFTAKLPEGLDTDVGETGARFSGGEKQRISLARALVGNPKLLILDEVTSALDPETEAEIVSNIAALRGQYTIVAITHRPAWTQIADRLYNVSKGSVTRQKAAPRLTARPRKPTRGGKPVPAS